LLEIFHFVLHRHFQKFGSCVMSNHFKSIINIFLTHLADTPQNRMKTDVWLIQIFYFQNKWNYLHKLWERNNIVEWPWSVFDHGESLKNIIFPEWIGTMQETLDYMKGQKNCLVSRNHITDWQNDIISMKARSFSGHMTVIESFEDLIIQSHVFISDFWQILSKSYSSRKIVKLFTFLTHCLIIFLPRESFCRAEFPVWITILPFVW
jgi:hypothetical protein